MATLGGESSSSGGLLRSSGAGRRDADSFYVEDCETAKANTHAIQTLTGQISRMVSTLAADEDIKACRLLVDDAVSQASETQKILKRIQEHQRQAQNASERSNRRMMYHKLSDNLAITARVLEDVVQRFSAEERKLVARRGFEGSAPSSISVAAGDAAGGEEELQREQCEAQKRVDADISCLQRIYSDLAVTAEQQQGDSVENLEHQLQFTGTEDLEMGAEEIVDPRNKQVNRTLWAGVATVLAVISVSAFLTSG